MFSVLGLKGLKPRDLLHRQWFPIKLGPSQQISKPPADESGALLQVTLYGPATITDSLLRFGVVFLKIINLFQTASGGAKYYTNY